MQPTSPLHGYPPGSSPYGYPIPQAVRSSGISTNHWRSAVYTSQGNWTASQSQPPYHSQHHLPESPLSNLPSVGQVPITSNTVHYHGDHLSTVSSSVGLTSHSGSIAPGWNSHMQSQAVGLQGQNKLSVSTSAPIPNQVNIRQEIKSEDEDLADPTLLRHKVLELYMEAMERVRVTYRDKLQELFFLQNGGNLVDYPGWRKRQNPQLVAFLNASRLDHEVSISTPTATNTVSPSIQAQAAFTNQNHPLLMYQVARHPVVEHMDPRLMHNQQGKPAHLQVGGSPYSQNYGFNPPFSQPLPPQSVSQQPMNIGTAQPQVNQNAQYNTTSAPTPGSVRETLMQNHSVATAQSSVQSSLSAMYAPVLGTQEEIALQARKEQEILQRVSELRKQGLWSASRLPKVHEPPRKKAHWDYLLEEMQWLATDFAQERRWKRNMARKVSKSVMKYHQDKKMKEQRAKKEESARLRRIASSIAKEVKQFWQSIEKVAQFKHQSRLEERRKKALDLHLNFIVDQTEKYSSWLVEGFKSSEKDSTVSSPRSTRNDAGSDAYEGSEGDEDDEGTIEEEEELEQDQKYSDEIEALQKESEMSLDDVIDSLPMQMINHLKALQADGSDNLDEHSLSDDEEDSVDDDLEFTAVDQDDADDEETLAEQESKEKDKVDHKEEIENLEKEGDMPLSELLKLYDIDQSEIGVKEEDKKEDASEVEAFSTDDDMSEDGTEALLEETEAESQDESMEAVPDEMLNNVAATAESLQPKGFTLLTTEVKTSIPFLLHHTLREYQHIGLDWLVTIYEKQLNGILADEMGLGKTIETIALLAHLACEKEIWGPHLIVVPTSVMLNWEYEFKKWVPGFKILTYYGTQKERKLKRQGWSKPNAFHICITSYKLVLQDHQAFRRRKWKYLILDEAQNIKNFKSQRWQTLLNFNSQRRLLLTGTPLQNNLMELWSLMHFLMPHLFTSHHDFKEWFSNPLTGMIEGSQEYNENIVKRLHKVLRPFLLRRMKSEVETQLPKKYEHVIRCYLSKRQRYLYEEFMSRTKTKETLESGNFLSVINILMQLRKVCNHPDLFETRPTLSSFIMDTGITYRVPSLLLITTNRDPFEFVDLKSLNFCFADTELRLTAFASHRTQDLQCKRKLIEELDSLTSEASLTRGINEPAPSNIFDILNPDGVKSNIDSNNSNDVNEIDVVGDIDNEDSLQVDVETKAGRLLDDYVNTDNSLFTMPSLKEKTIRYRKERLARISKINARRCAKQPIYGSDLCDAVMVNRGKQNHWIGALSHQRKPISTYCMTIDEMIRKPADILDELNDIVERFVFVIPAVDAPRAAFHVSHPPPAWLSEQKQLETIDEAVANSNYYWNIERQMKIQFPETRLIQYDCGKLQTLDVLLRMLKPDKHRALIFTQMTKMLDVLEKFLTYHGHIYLRLDGTTKVEQRQVLMERFNQDPRIFCFILSTRSGGIGVNLTGADTVIFYDSDWNPTMDAQAQDRCHRIGQTRDVHIYRLICEHTIEENILKKANEKRILGDIAIEGGNFNTAFFKKKTIKDLFDVRPDSEQMPFSGDGRVAAIETGEGVIEVESIDNVEPQVPESRSEKKKIAAFEQALFKAEDEQDVRAASTAKAEQVAEMAEFNENVPLKTDDENEEGRSKVEEEIANLENELTLVERYAVRFLESTCDYYNIEDVDDAEKQIEVAKKEWELEHLQAKKEAEERKNAAEEDDMFFTYAKDETYDQPYIDDYTGTEMPIWTPPTPPGGEDEVIMDATFNFLYESNIIPENHLPPTNILKKNGMDLYAVKSNSKRTHYLGVFKRKRCAFCYFLALLH